ncbi:MAG: TfoX/Sxy family protein [Fimbriimonadaceae bacterium]|nr:TfoX/Sxy family protein [Fimbriimonadaceae bacterium]
MHSDLELVEHLRDLLVGRPGLIEKKMFGGACFHLNGNICCGVYKSWLIARVGLEAAARLLQEPGCTPMDITGKPMRGWVKLEKEQWQNPAIRERYVDRSFEFVSTLPSK